MSRLLKVYPVSDERPRAGEGASAISPYGFIDFDGAARLCVLGKIGEKYNQLGREVGFG